MAFKGKLHFSKQELKCRVELLKASKQKRVEKLDFYFGVRRRHTYRRNAPDIWIGNR